MRTFLIIVFAALCVQYLGMDRALAEVGKSVQEFRRSQFFKKYRLQQTGEPCEFHTNLNVNFSSRQGVRWPPFGIKMMQFRGDQKDYLVTILITNDTIIFQGCAFTIAPQAAGMSATVIPHLEFVLDLVDEAFGYRTLVSGTSGGIISVREKMKALFIDIDRSSGPLIGVEHASGRSVWAEKMFKSSNEVGTTWLMYVIESSPPIDVLPDLIRYNNGKFFGESDKALAVDRPSSENSVYCSNKSLKECYGEKVKIIGILESSGPGCREICIIDRESGERVLVPELSRDCQKIKELYEGKQVEATGVIEEYACQPGSRCLAEAVIKHVISFRPRE